MDGWMHTGASVTSSAFAVLALLAQREGGKPPAGGAGEEWGEHEEDREDKQCVIMNLSAP